MLDLYLTNVFIAICLESYITNPKIIFFLEKRFNPIEVLNLSNSATK